MPVENKTSRAARARISSLLLLKVRLKADTTFRVTSRRLRMTGWPRPASARRRARACPCSDRCERPRVRGILICDQHQRASRIDREIPGNFDAARFVPHERHPPVVPEPKNDDAVVAAVRTVKKPAAAMDVTSAAEAPTMSAAGGNVGRICSSRSNPVFAS